MHSQLCDAEIVLPKQANHVDYAAVEYRDQYGIFGAYIY
jgi:hypothetical protein